MFVNAIAALSAPNEVSDGFLKELGCEAPSDSMVVRQRHSLLPLDYLRETRNAHPERARSAMSLSSVVLAAEAVRLALRQANIAIKDVGCILGDPLVPLELIPSEAQRVARELGIKVPSFDIGTAGVGLPVLFDTVSKWKQERFAKPIVCFSVQTPTMAVDYSAGLARTIFSDAAVASVISLEENGFRFLRSVVSVPEKAFSIVTMPINGHVDLASSFLEASTKAVSRLRNEFQQDVPEPMYISNFGQVGTAVEHGESLGASIGLLLEEPMKKLESKERIAFGSVGCGQMLGGVALEKV